MTGITIKLPADPLVARYLKRFNMRRGAYDGGNGRRFVLFTKGDRNEIHEWRREFDTKRQRDQFAIGWLTGILQKRALENQNV